MRTYRFWYKIILSIISFGVIAFVFKTSLISLCLIIGGFALMLIGLKAFLSYANPSKSLYRYRFLGYGLAQAIYGGFFVLYLVSGSSISNIWSWIAALVFLAFFIAFFDWLSYQKTKKQLKIKFHLKSETYDSAIVKDAENQTFHGRLFLAGNTLSFCALQGKRIFTEIDVVAAAPKLIRNKTFHFPIGLYFPHHQIKIYVNFPLFWLKTLHQKELHTLIA